MAHSLLVFFVLLSLKTSCIYIHSRNTVGFFNQPKNSGLGNKIVSSFNFATRRHGGGVPLTN